MGKTDICTLIPELGGGTLEGQLNVAMDDLAANVATHNKKGRLTLTFDLAPIGSSHQVRLTHTLKVVVPKAGRGKVTEELGGETALVVGTGGKLTLFPDVPTGKQVNAPARSKVEG